MRSSIITDYAVMLLLALVLSACARPEENAATSNSNAAGQANSNSASTQGPPGSMTPSPGTPLVVQQLPAPPAKPLDAATQPAAKPAGDKAVGSAERAPKLVAPEKRVDFGKQPQDKNLIRAIAIRNGGRADLKIESVVPSWGCTTVDFPKVLRPGQAGKIKVKVETGKAPGEHVKSVTIKSNDPNDPSHIVQFVFDVKG